MLYLKKFYHDDPCLKKAKIIYSLYDEPAPVEIPDTLFECLKFDKIKPAALSVLDESGVHFLPYTPVEGCAEAYNEFYKKILP